MIQVSTRIPIKTSYSSCCFCVVTDTVDEIHTLTIVRISILNDDAKTFCCKG